MPQCRAVTNSDERCTKTTRRSKYCWFHKDYGTGALLGIILGVAGVLATLAVGAYQERNPFVSVRCALLDGSKPTGIECRVHNTGRGKAHDVRVSFNAMLPLDTVVYASPEVGAELIPSPTPPDPEKDPSWAKTQLAFSVRIPRAIPNVPVTFQITTINADNENAGGQILRMREESRTVLKMFIEQLEKVNPEAARRLNYDKIISSQMKRHALYTPAQFSYEAGRQRIEYISEDEEAAEALFNDIRNQNIQILNSIREDRPSFMAPMIRIKMIKGDGLSFAAVPLVSVCLQFGGIVKGRGNLPVIVPKSYEDGICKNP